MHLILPLEMWGTPLTEAASRPVMVLSGDIHLKVGVPGIWQDLQSVTMRLWNAKMTNCVRLDGGCNHSAPGEYTVTFTSSRRVPVFPEDALLYVALLPIKRKYIFTVVLCDE